MNMKRVTKTLQAAATALALLAVVTFSGTPAQAEVEEVVLAKQFGLIYLPLILMENYKLVEKHAKAQGVGGVKTKWFRFTSGAQMIDGLLSKNLHFASGGLAPMLKIWGKTKKRLNVKGVSAIAVAPIKLNTMDPNIKKLTDFKKSHRIALPAVKVSMQATLIQMAAEKIYGRGNHTRMDDFTVSMKHPDAMAAMLSGTEITAHFATPPYYFQELQNPKVHTVTTATEIMGGTFTALMFFASSKFKKENPKTYRAVFNALKESIGLINKDHKKAAEDYVKFTKSKVKVKDVLGMLNDPALQFTTTPQNTFKLADFMYRTKSIKRKANGWKDYFHENAHSLKGS